MWALCEDLQLPIHTHSGPGAHKDYGNAPGWMSVYGYETIWFTARPLWFMLLTGVFERYPRLKMSVVEAGSFWAADLLWRTDMIAIKDHGARKMGSAARGHLSMLPSEYFDRNCGIGSSNTRRRELARSVRDRRRQHHVGERLPAPRGHLALHPRVPQGPLLGHPGGRDREDPRPQRRGVLQLRPREARAHREKIGPTPEELGQTDTSVLAKWDDLKAAGRPWLTEIEAVPVPVG